MPFLQVIGWSRQRCARTGLELLSRRKKAITEAEIVSTLKRLCEWSGHGGTSGARASTTFISSNTGEEGVLEGILEVVGLVMCLVFRGVVYAIYSGIRTFNCWV